MKKRIQKIIGLFLILLLIMPFALAAGAKNAKAEEIIEIHTYEELLQMAEHPEGSYVLAQDIACGEKEWIPIDFSGTFDGNGHAILNLRTTLCGKTTRTTYDGNMKEYDTSFAGRFGSLPGHLAVVIISLIMIVGVVLVDMAERRIPVQYAKKVVGRKMYGGQNSTLPIKLNNTGVMPIIFASSIVSIPATVGMFVNPKKGTFWAGFFDLFDSGSWLYAVLTLVLIIAFAYFYILISFNPVEVSNNLKKQGGSIPGIRPGKPTSDYITKILNRITLIGAIFLAFIAVVPMIINICTGGKMNGLTFGGSSIIIVVGVAIETMREIEGQLTMRHYKGFLE